VFIVGIRLNRALRVDSAHIMACENNSLLHLWNKYSKFV
jgi:hypothetical protein